MTGSPEKERGWARERQHGFLPCLHGVSRRVPAICGSDRSVLDFFFPSVTFRIGTFALYASRIAA